MGMCTRYDELLRTTRREALILGLGLPWLASCLADTTQPLPTLAKPRLSARPGAPTASMATGTHEVSVDGSSAVVHIPAGVDQDTPVALLLFLHGALRTVDAFINGHRPLADAANVVVAAPYAYSGTWDAVRGAGFDRDIRIINATLETVFQRWTIDPARIVLSGFSDGATYTLAVGRANGDLFSRVVAYSPGFLIPVEKVDSPPILISHGTLDRVLPIDQTSRLIVPQLRSMQYDVDYREFEGQHSVPLSVVEELIGWMAT